MANEILTPMKLYLQSGNGLESLSGMTEGLNQAVSSALRRYDRDRPRKVSKTITGAGTDVYDLSNSLPDWSEGASRVTRVEYPWIVGEDNELRLDQWEVYEDPTDGATLCLVSLEPAATESILVQITVPWAEGTIPSHHIDAVAKLAASGVCRMMAARTLQGGESTYSADRFHAPTASDNWIKLAKMYEGQYEEGIGLGSDGDTKSGGGSGLVKAACAIFPIDTGDRLIPVDDGND